MDVTTIGPRRFAAATAASTARFVQIAVFVGGKSFLFDDVDTETINFFKQDDTMFLRFRLGARDAVIPNVDYWTEEAR